VGADRGTGERERERAARTRGGGGEGGFACAFRVDGWGRGGENHGSEGCV